MPVKLHDDVVGELVTRIVDRRHALDTAFNDHIRKLRRQYGDGIVDQALGEARKREAAIAAASRPDWRVGPKGRYG